MLAKTPSSRAALAIAIGCLVLFPAFAALTFVHWGAERPPKDVTLVYVGADNCAPCVTWQRNERTTFRGSPEFRRLAYREVKSPTLFDVLADENWPVELRAYRQTISQRAGVPLWLVIADDRIVLQSSGLTQWQAAILPKIKSLLR
ncbi:MAG: hypothetical protein K9G60_09295 [Pseudolabrys sp.]|nr:hypothetical protein [Pseudolabrys sp.]